MMPGRGSMMEGVCGGPATCGWSPPSFAGHEPRGRSSTRAPAGCSPQHVRCAHGAGLMGLDRKKGPSSAARQKRRPACPRCVTRPPSARSVAQRVPAASPIRAPPCPCCSRASVRCVCVCWVGVGVGWGWQAGSRPSFPRWAFSGYGPPSGPLPGPACDRPDPGTHR